MSSSSQTIVPSSHFKSILDAALSEYKTKTGNDLTTNSLAKELQGCKSAEAVLDIIQREAKAFEKFRDGDKRLMKWIGPSVDVLCTISATLGQGVGMAFPSTNVVSAGIGVLLAVAKDVRASHDVLVDLFERIQFFLKRLGVHTRISPTKDMVEILVRIMAEVLSILSIATKEVQQSRTKTYLKKLVGRTDIEDALKRLDALTREEVQMAIAQILKATDELKDNVTKANTAMEQTANTVDEIMDNLDEIMDDVDEIMDDIDEMKDFVVEIKWNQIEQDVQKWFSPPDPSVNYNTACEAYQDGTAAWFFQGSIFKEWELIDSLLWIHGKPGSGKSVLCSAIIKHVISLRNAGHASLAYFFFDFRDKEKESVRNFLTSLLIQLSAHLDSCRKIISRIYWAHGKGTQQPSIDVLTSCLHEMLFVAAEQPVYIIIDAIDECPNISGLPTPRAVLLDILEELVELRIPNLHICITSRPDIDIRIVLEPLAYSAISLHEESGQQKDISDYVRKIVYSDRKMRRWRDRDKKMVVRVLSEKADGMFRWVFCQLAVLQHCLASSIRQTLDQLPRTLDETYARVLSQIPLVNRENAHRMLQGLMVAFRPLRVEELAELLAFEFGEAQGAIPKYRTDWRPNDRVEAVLSTCSSLIVIVDDHGSQVVQFSHFSVKEFLMSNRLTSTLGDFSQYQILPGPAHTILAEACLGLLLHLEGHADEEIVNGFPLAEYAAKNWVTHAQFEDVASRMKDGMETLFDCDKPHFAAWVGIYNMDDESSLKSPSIIPIPLYYASLCGFSDLVEHLATEHPQHVNAIGGKHSFPLLVALVRKHNTVAEILLKHGANVNVQGIRGRAPLHEAIRDVSMVQSLLKNGADVNCRQDDLRTPLHDLAAYDGDLEVARVLVEHKANVDSQDNEGNTPFHLLLEHSSRDDGDILNVARLLLGHGTDVNIQTTNKWTLLHAAAFRGRLEIAKALLDHGANPNAESKEGETPLILVSRGEYDAKEHGVSIARLLLKHGVDVHVKNHYHDTALLWAAFKGRLGIAQLLLDSGANPNEGNGDDGTPLHLVSEGKYNSHENGLGIARLLLERSVDVNAQNKNKATPLHAAALNGRLDIVQALLDHGADPKAENEAGETALHSASRGEYDSQENGVSITRLLLEHGVDVNAQNKSFATALHLAAFDGRFEIVQLLLEHGANPNAKNEQGRTPLDSVSRGIYKSQEHGAGIARVLLERGTDVNAQEESKFTALHWAAFHGKLDIVQVLLDHGAQTDIENNLGETPLHLVSQGDYDSQEHGVRIARQLLEHGGDANARTKERSTPLHSAVSKGKPEIAHVLLDHGANADMANDQGETPLHLVSQRTYDSQDLDVSIAQQLLEHGVDVHAQNEYRDTALHMATLRGRLEVIQLLLEYGANPNMENKQGKTPLHTVLQDTYTSVSQEHRVGIARLFLERGVDVNARRNNDPTPLHSAASQGWLELAKVLLDHGANPNAAVECGSTPLHVLLSRGNYDNKEHDVSIAGLFLKHGADVDAQNKDRNTALHLAALGGRLEIVQLLLDHGANPKMENEQGKTPLHLVSQLEGTYNMSQAHRIGIVRLLLEHGVDVNVQRRGDPTPLHSAASCGWPDIARLLLEHGANPNAVVECGDTPLHMIVSRGEYEDESDIGIARLLLKHGVDVDVKNKYHDTALLWAAFKGRLEISQLLLDNDANPNEGNEDGGTPLHLVSEGKYNSHENGLSIARLLLERGVDVNARKKKDKATPLHSAAFNGRLDIAQVLLDRGANLNAENVWGETALHLVLKGKPDSQENGVGIARLLLEHGVDVNAQNKSFATALHLAAFDGRSEVVQLLLENGANPNAKNEQGRTPLDSVSQGKYWPQEHGVSVARLLLEHSVDVNAQEKSGFTALHRAAFHGRLDIVQALLDHDASVDVKNNEGKTPLHLVSQGDHSSQEPHGVSIACQLLERGVDVHAPDKNYDTPLHSAAFYGMSEIAKLLLDRGANVNVENKLGRTPLHQVAQGEYDSQAYGVGVAQLLLERGVDVHAQDKNNDTALHLSAFSGSFSIATLLLDHGANATAENEHGETPLHLVSRGNYNSQENRVGIAQLLLERGVDIDARDRHQNTPLHSASSLGSLENARVLLDRGAKVGSENDRAQTPLHLASQGNYWFQDDGLGVAKLLLERGADMHAQDKDYATPLHLACYRGRLDIAKVLLDHDAKAQTENDQDLVSSVGQEKRAVMDVQIADQ